MSVSDKRCREKQNTRFMFINTFFFENRAFFLENVEKFSRTRHAIGKNMAHTHYMLYI
jgi:hypothetical protein